ncbi:hypothetical protein TWF506_004740 [Arthrobotrys conoides]|uniref:F-box domain-containing protein n=1 Tax=Arthrobotrys conoides TaxID=74498 RepID=A0AAN8N6C5_9PEZI
MALDIPPELWLEIISSLTYEDVHFGLKRVNRSFHRLIGGLTIHRLPLSLWEQIFTHLDYSTLLKTSSSCKSFRGCIKYSDSKQIQASTFRERLFSRTMLPPGTKFSLHPVFEHLQIGRSPSSAFLYVIPRHMEGCLKPIDIDSHPIVSENITSPPVQLYEIQDFDFTTFGEGGGHSDHMKPATIKDVILDMQRLGDERSHCTYLTRVDTESMEIIQNGTTREFVSLEGRRVVKDIEYGAVVLRLLAVPDWCYNGYWIDEEESERNAEW